MTILDLKAPLRDERKTNEVKFTLVNELLGAVLADQDEEILVEAKSQNFLYDRGRGLEIEQTLEVGVEWEKVEKTDREIEIKLSGIVSNHLNQKIIFTLYFFMWWDYGAFPLSQKTVTFGKKNGEKSLTIKAGNSKEHLSDTVFEINLYRKSLLGRHQFLGHGRGYLFFCQ